MTFDEIIQTLKANPQHIDDATVDAVLNLLQTKGRSVLSLLMRRVDTTPINLRLNEKPAFHALMKTWANEKGPSRCPDNESGEHCLHMEDVTFTEDDDEEPEKLPICCFCGTLFTGEADDHEPNASHGVYVGDPSRDELVKAKSRMIIEGRTYIHTERHGFAMAQLYKAADIEEELAETAGTDPNAPQREDHLRSAESLRVLAQSKV